MTRATGPLTEEEVNQWCIGTFSNHTLSRLTDILNGDYDANEAREDCLSIVRPSPKEAA